MQVICTDGTAFSCEGYELTEYGLVLYDQPKDPETERYDSDPAQAGYVPHDRLWYVLPDGVEPNVAGLTQTQLGSPAATSGQNAPAAGRQSPGGRQPPGALGGGGPGPAPGPGGGPQRG